MIPPSKTWTLENLEECSPADFILGHIAKRHVGDETSLTLATLALLTATFAKAGCDFDAAFAKAEEAVASGVRFTWDGDSLGVVFGDDEPDSTEAHGEDSEDPSDSTLDEMFGRILSEN